MVDWLIDVFAKSKILEFTIGVGSGNIRANSGKSEYYVLLNVPSSYVVHHS